MQRFLERKVQKSLYFMGVGSGTGVMTSGERSILRALKKQTPPPYCIFDVGANQGQFLNLVRNHIATDDFKIHCFEPGRGTYRILLENAGNDERVILNNIGIGKERGEATLFYDSVGSGLASLTKRNLNHFNMDLNESETVEIDTIDNYCSQNMIDRIQLLKIDIEGHELDALLGADRMISSQAIDIVTFEFGGCNIDTRTYFQDFWYYFKDFNFSIFRITPAGYLHPINDYKEIYEQFRTTNFIAIADNR
jgi:FkbM family methyltransferase